MRVLNRDDDKRISKKDGISTLAHGHASLVPWGSEATLQDPGALKSELENYFCKKLLPIFCMFKNAT